MLAVVLSDYVPDYFKRSPDDPVVVNVLTVLMLNVRLPILTVKGLSVS